MLVTDPVFWGMDVPRGDGHPVLLIPGLLANDDYLRPMSNWLGRHGYSPIWSGLRIDPGFSESAIRRITERVEQEHQSTGSRVSIIGHSMGGALARAAALRVPNAVRHVITLGSPLFYGAQYQLVAFGGADRDLYPPRSHRAPSTCARARRPRAKYRGGRKS